MQGCASPPAWALSESNLDFQPHVYDGLTFEAAATGYQVFNIFFPYEHLNTGVMMYEHMYFTVAKTDPMVILKGTSDTTLSPAGPCTVEQAILLAYRLYQQVK